MNTSLTENRSAGFTLIEVGIIVPILIVMVLVIFDALFLMIRASSVEGGRISLAYDKQTAISNIEADAVLASLYLPAKDGTYPDPYAPSGGWSYKGDGTNSRVLITRMYSTNLNPLDVNRAPAFINDSDPDFSSACDGSRLYQKDVLEHNVIYFVKNNILYKRKVVDATSPLCGTGQYQKLSCPSQADLTAQGLGTRNTSCKADDEILARDVSSFTVQYYGSKSSTTPLDVYQTGADPDLVTTAVDVEVSLTITRKVSGESISSTSKLRMSKINGAREAEE